tara:strand:- start:147 stop:326 length:180 start_codon:yes stop_codon:yes gene_type:complete
VRTQLLLRSLPLLRLTLLTLLAPLARAVATALSVLQHRLPRYEPEQRARYQRHKDSYGE